MSLLPVRLYNSKCSLRPMIRLFSNQFKDHKIALTDDESMYVAWHPKPDFPYECTKALPEDLPEQDTSVLKTKMTPKLQEIFNKKPQDLIIQELMNITHTTKHRWYLRARDKKAKKTPMDREYL